MSTDQYETRGGIRVRRTVDDIPMANAIEPLIDALDAHRGALLASSYEYPGRYTRWDMGFVDPPLALVARGRSLPRRGAESRGDACCSAPIAAGAGRASSALEQLDAAGDGIEGTVRAPAGRLRRGGPQPAAVGLLGAARADRAVPPSRRATPRLSTAPSATTWRSSSSPSASRLARPRGSARPGALPPRRAHRSWTTGARSPCAVATTSRCDGRSTVGLPREGRRTPVRRRPRRAPRSRDHAPGEYAAMVRVAARPVQARRPLRGRARPDVLRGSAPRRRRAVPPAARAQPRAVRLPDEPGRRGVPGRRLARDVRARRRRPRRDLPDLGHDRARRATPSATPRRSSRCSTPARTSPSSPCAPTSIATTSRASASRAACA